LSRSVLIVRSPRVATRTYSATVENVSSGTSSIATVYGT
jgi:hypothetical protein